MTSNKEKDETQRNFAKVFLGVEAVCRKHGINNKTGVNPYRIIITKKNLDSPDFDFAKYIKGHPEEFNSKEASKFEDTDNIVTIGDYKFYQYKTTKGTRGDIKETIKALRDTKQWFMILPCKSLQQTWLNLNPELGEVQKNFKLFINPRTGIKRDYHLTLKEKINCDDIKAPQSNMGQCLISKNLELTKSALNLYKEASLEKIYENDNDNFLKVVSFNLSNFKSLVVEETYENKTKKLKHTEKTYNPFAEELEEDFIQEQLNNIIMTNPDIICLQQASESSEYKRNIYNYFQEGATARLGVNFRIAYSDVIPNNTDHLRMKGKEKEKKYKPKGRLRKPQVEELCMYHLSMQAFQYLWRLRESRVLFKKISFQFLLRWLLTAAGHLTDINITDAKLNKKNNQIIDQLVDLKFADEVETELYKRLMDRLTKKKKSNLATDLNHIVGDYHQNFSNLIHYYNEKIDKEWKDEQKLYDFEVKQLYNYRKKILDQTKYKSIIDKNGNLNIIKERPEIVHTVATEFKKEMKKPANLWEIFKKTDYYKTRFGGSEPKDYEKIIEQIASNSGYNIENIEKKDSIHFSRPNTDWEKHRYKYQNKKSKKKGKSKVGGAANNAILVSPKETTLTLIGSEPLDEYLEDSLKLKPQYYTKYILPNFNDLKLQDYSKYILSYLDDKKQINQTAGYWGESMLKRLRGHKDDEDSDEESDKDDDKDEDKDKDNAILVSPEYEEDNVILVSPEYEGDNVILVSPEYEDEKFNSAAWAQEECYRILNIHDGVAPMHNGVNRRGGYNAKYQYEQIAWSYEHSRSSYLELFNTTSVNYQNKKVITEIRKEESIIKPRLSYKRGGKSSNYFTDISDNNNIVLNQTFHNKEPFADNTDLFEQFHEIWRELISAFDHNTPIRNTIQDATNPNLQNYDDNNQEHRDSVKIFEEDPLIKKGYFNLEDIARRNVPEDVIGDNRDLAIRKGKYNSGHLIISLLRYVFQTIKGDIVEPHGFNIFNTDHYISRNDNANDNANYNFPAQPGIPPVNVNNIESTDYVYPEHSSLGVFNSASRFGSWIIPSRPDKIKTETDHDNNEQYPTEIEKTNIKEIDNRELSRWVVNDLWGYFKARYGNITDNTLRYLWGDKAADMIDDNDENKRDLHNFIRRQGGYRSSLKFKGVNEEDFREHSARIFDILLGPVFVNKHGSTKNKFINRNRLQETFIHKKMYEDSFNNIVDECAFYKYKLFDRLADMKGYMDDYVISQRSWLDFYLEGHNFKKHSLTKDGFGLYYKTQLRNGIKITEKTKPVDIQIKSPFLHKTNMPIIVGQKSQLEIGGKDKKSTVSLNIVNIDMQYWDKQDMPKLNAELEKLNFGKNPTLLVGSFPISTVYRHIKGGNTGTSSDENQQKGGKPETVILVAPKEEEEAISPPKEDGFLTRLMKHSLNKNADIINVFDAVCSENCQKRDKYNIAYPEISDYLTEKKDIPTANLQYLINTGSFNYKRKEDSDENLITVEGTHMIYTDKNRHVGRITEFSLSDKVDSKITHVGGKKTKKVREHKGIIQIGGNAGRLRKGYKYTGKRLKSGLSQIVRVNTNKN